MKGIAFLDIISFSDFKQGEEKLLVGSGHPWSPLVASGRLWSSLVASGRLWSSLVVSGRLWSPLVASGRLWSPLVASGRLEVGGMGENVKMIMKFQELNLRYKSFRKKLQGVRGGCSHGKPHGHSDPKCPMQ